MIGVPTVNRERDVRAGGWRTLEKFWGTAEAIGVFDDPSGAHIKMRYGWGWFGFDRQEQQLTGTSAKYLRAGGLAGVGRQRMQMKVDRSTTVLYTLQLTGPG